METFIRPSIVIASTTALILPENIVKDILEVNEIPSPVKIVGVVEACGYPWHIETKYYSADVNLCTLNTKTLGTKEFAESVEALILCFDSNSETAINDIEQWFTFTKEFDPDIKILICNCCAENPPQNSVSKVEAQKWCIKNGFELVELNPEEEAQDSDVEDDFAESLGMKRVIQALQAHMWQNLSLKDYQSSLTSNLQSAIKCMESVNLKENNSTEKDSKAKKIAIVKPMMKSEMVEESNKEKSPVELSNVSNLNGPEQGSSRNDGRLPVITTKDENTNSMVEAIDSMGEDTFEQLFQNLNEMKAKAESLSPTQRKVYAEKMAIAFWRSIGGNESEIDGLSSEDESEGRSQSQQIN